MLIKHGKQDTCTPLLHVHVHVHVHVKEDKNSKHSLMVCLIDITQKTMDPNSFLSEIKVVPSQMLYR